MSRLKEKVSDVETDVLLRDLRQTKRELEDSQRTFRQVVWDCRRVLEDPSISQEERIGQEELAFDAMENLKRCEESIADIDLSIADLQHAREQEANANSAEMTVGVIVAIVFFILMLWLLLR